MREHITGRDQFIIRIALSYAIQHINHMPEWRKNNVKSYRAEMERLAERLEAGDGADRRAPIC